MNVLEVQNLSKAIGKKQILNDISFEVSAGEIIGLIGPNGAGKSTLMKSITGLIFPDKGSISICGKNIYTEREAALSYLSATIEAPALYTQFTGIEHLKMIAALRKLPKTDVEEAMEFSDLKERIYDKVTKYSMGMKQRLYLTMAVMSKPKLLILDEPTNGIDFTNVMAFCDEMQTIASQGTSILISSHILGDLQKMCDQFIFLKQGEIQRIVQKASLTDIEKIYLEIFGESTDA